MKRPWGRIAAKVAAAVLAIVLPVMAWGMRVETFVVIGALFGTRLLVGLLGPD
jgi:hypothetical protein